MGAGSATTWQMNPVTLAVTWTRFRQGIVPSEPSPWPCPALETDPPMSLRHSRGHTRSRATKTQSSLLSDGMPCDKGQY